MTWNQQPSTSHKLELTIPFYIYTPAKVFFILKDASMGIIVSDVGGELIAVHNVVTGT